MLKNSKGIESFLLPNLFLFFPQLFINRMFFSSYCITAAFMLIVRSLPCTLLHFSAPDQRSHFLSSLTGQTSAPLGNLFFFFKFLHLMFRGFFWKCLMLGRLKPIVHQTRITLILSFRFPQMNGSWYFVKIIHQVAK